MHSSSHTLATVTGSADGREECPPVDPLPRARVGVIGGAFRWDHGKRARKTAETAAPERSPVQSPGHHGAAGQTVCAPDSGFPHSCAKARRLFPLRGTARPPSPLHWCRRRQRRAPPEGDAATAVQRTKRRRTTRAPKTWPCIDRSIAGRKGGTGALAVADAAKAASARALARIRRRCAYRKRLSCSLQPSLLHCSCSANNEAAERRCGPAKGRSTSPHRGPQPLSGPGSFAAAPSLRSFSPSRFLRRCPAPSLVSPLCKRYVVGSAGENPRVAPAAAAVGHFGICFSPRMARFFFTFPSRYSTLSVSSAYFRRLGEGPPFGDVV